MKQKLYPILMLCALLLAAPAVRAATYYGIKVGGVSVTSDNASNVTGSNITANNSERPYKVSYDASTKTLTLDNVRIYRTGSYNRAILNESCEGLTIVFRSHCYLQAKDASPVRLNASTTMKSVAYAKIEVWGGNEDGLTVGSGATLTLDRAHLFVWSTNSDGLCGDTGKENVVVKNNSIVLLTSSDGDNQYAIYKVASISVERSFFSASEAKALKAFSMSADMLALFGWYDADEQGFGLDGKAFFKAAPCIYINEANFPDANLRKYLLGTDFNYAGYGALIRPVPVGADGDYDPAYYLKIDRSRTLDKLSSLQIANKGIASLQGIGVFTGLRQLDCSGNGLTSIDLTPFPQLEEVNCSKNKIASLDLSRNPELTVLQCVGNKLSSLAINNLRHLSSLDCHSNNLTALDLSSLAALAYLNCEANKISSLALGCKDSLEALRCSTNNLTELDLHEFPQLSGLACNGNQLTSLLLPRNLTEVECNNNKLTELNLSGSGNLTHLYCGDNNLQTLRVQNCAVLEQLDCSGNKLTALPLTGCPELVMLDCSNNLLTDLTLSGNTGLATIAAARNQLKTLDLLWNREVQSVDLWGNQISGEGLDNLISNLPALSGRSLFLVNHTYADEANECTAAQVQAAKNRGWTIYHQTGKSQEVTSACKNYDLWIAGKRTCNHGTLVSGTSYDDATKTLTLNNADVSYDGTIGILSKVDNLNVKLTGKNTISTSGSSVGMRLMKNTEAGKVSFSGGGELNITSGGVGLQTYGDVEFKDGVKVSAESTGTLAGLQGRKFSADGDFPSIIISGEGTEVKAKGGTQGSVLNFHALNFSNGIAIAEPTGATFAADYGVVKDNRIVAGEWVVFARSATSANPYDLNKDGSVDVSDVTELVSYVLNPDGSHGTDYDLNKDGAVDVSDVTELVSAVLAQ
ncbi:MAG: hypothetical protein IJ722_03325 [Alloprevotella sp.]|nr:hypothetical protein [Prevotella sp.]MBR1712415.1 hypothetical protein [Alloprevotella sp.]